MKNVFASCRAIIGTILFVTIMTGVVWGSDSDGNILLIRSAEGKVYQLCPDFRRDSIAYSLSTATGEDEIAGYYIGEAEQAFLAEPRRAFWDQFVDSGRFNETNPISMVPIESVVRNGQSVIGVREGDVITATILSSKHLQLPEKTGDIHVLQTPGFTRNSVSYMMDDSIYCGNLIYGAGHLLNLYDLQDSFDGTTIGGYHGYMARAAKLIAGLKKIRELKPKRLVPSRGPVIDNPEEAIDLLIGRLQKIYQSYLKTTALWWYFGEETMTQSARYILDDHSLMPTDIERMNRATLHENPGWLIEFSTTRIILSETGAAFVIDCNSPREFEKIRELQTRGAFKTVEGIFVTHYHNDHISGVKMTADYFGCPVYCSEMQRHILENPTAYRMPCVADCPLDNIQVLDSMPWHEFDFKFYYFPGQTLYHDALLVNREGETPLFFIGDSFNPSGLDDYCLWNRNFPGDNQGYLFCLELIQSMNPHPQLVNEHVRFPFSFDDSQLELMKKSLKERREMLQELFPYDAPGFGVDSNWARIDPYCLSLDTGEKTCQLVILNHSDRKRTFELRSPSPTNPVLPTIDEIEINGGSEGIVPLSFNNIAIDRDYELASLTVRCKEEPALEMSVEMIITK